MLLALLGCAAPPAKKDPRDPWERINRTTYKFNDKVDKAVLRPLAKGYQKVTPGFVRTGVSNFVDNLGYPIVIVNDLLQARFILFARDTGRLLMNTTLGIGGLLDPASQAGLEKNENDFGLTFGRWGIPKGPYFVIPFLGPSDVRDGLGRIPGSYFSPQNYVNDWRIQYGIWALSLLDARYRLLPTDEALDSAYDPYLFMKNAYLQRRDFLLSQGSNKATSSESDADKLLDEATKEEEEQPAPGEVKPEQPKPNPPQSPPPQSQPPKSDQPQSDQTKPDQTQSDQQQPK
jgi:phospholipid-binding lipoprotein MlaA